MNRRRFLKRLGIGTAVVMGGITLGGLGYLLLSPEKPNLKLLEDFNDAYVSGGKLFGSSVQIRKVEGTIAYTLVGSSDDPRNLVLELNLEKDSLTTLGLQFYTEDFSYFSYFFQAVVGDIGFRTYINGNRSPPIAYYIDLNDSRKFVTEYSIKNYRGQTVDLEIQLYGKRPSKLAFDNFVMSRIQNVHRFQKSQEAPPEVSF